MNADDARLRPFDFELPDELIALRPPPNRDASRLLVVRGNGSLEDRSMRDLPKLLRSGDVLVFNDTRVLPAALEGVRPQRAADGRDVTINVNLIEALNVRTWRALARPGKRLKLGDPIEFAGGLTATVVEKSEAAQLVLEFDRGGDALEVALDTIGKMPLPPYIARRRAADSQDRERYQTVYASGPAESVAAPTAGLHFTSGLRDDLTAAGVKERFVRLRVGLGTFEPLTSEHMDTGKLHEESREVTEEAAVAINQVRADGGACVAIGTTSLRTLESAALPSGELQPVRGPTDLFIQPGYQFRSVDGLLTNFHLPKSSLFMLVCALMGTETMQAAYAHAVKHRYRFYSYGDACLLLP